MSTRAIYQFTDENGKHSVYVHHDGYPSGAAKKFRQALDLAWGLPRFEADEFAAAFVSKNKCQPGSVRLHNGQIPYDVAYVYRLAANKRGKLTLTAYTHRFDDVADKSRLKKIKAISFPEQLGQLETDEF